MALRYSEEDARVAVAAAHCWTQALRNLGMCPTGGAAATLKKWVKRWEIPTSHFDPYFGRSNAGRARRVPLEDVLIEGSSFSRGHLKKRLYDSGVKLPICEICGQGETWRGRTMALILDHANGVRDDHRLSNLRIVCPNCAATLDTHCGRNLPREKPCERCGTPFVPRTRERRFCSMSCATSGRHLGVLRPERRKVARPSEADLLADLESMSYCAVGRKYGVSDNAVRKWLLWYDRARARRDQKGA